MNKRVKSLIVTGVLVVSTGTIVFADDELSPIDPVIPPIGDQQDGESGDSEIPEDEDIDEEDDGLLEDNNREPDDDDPILEEEDELPPPPIPPIDEEKDEEKDEKDEGVLDNDNKETDDEPILEEEEELPPPIVPAPPVEEEPITPPANRFEGNDSNTDIEEEKHAGLEHEKIDDPKANGVYQIAGGGIKITIDEENKTANVEALSDDIQIRYVHMKGSNAFNCYIVEDGVTKVIELICPEHKPGKHPEISHITVFWEKVEDLEEPVVPEPEDPEEPVVPEPEDPEDPVVPEPEEPEDPVVPEPEDPEEPEDPVVPEPEEPEDPVVPEPEDPENKIEKLPQTGSIINNMTATVTSLFGMIAGWFGLKKRR